MNNFFLKLNKFKDQITIFYISILFSFFIFFWQIKYDFIQLRFLIILLILPIILNFNKKLFKKSLIYLFLSFLLIFHSYIQSNNFSSNMNYNFYSIFVLFGLFFIFDFYNNFFFKNLDHIIYSYLTIFFIFLIYQFFSYDDYFDEVSNKCIGCFSILKNFYRENSHFGLLASTVIYYLLFISKSNIYVRSIFFILFLIISLVNLSITFIAGIILMIFFIAIFNTRLILTYKFALFFIVFSIPVILNQELDRRKISDFFTINDKINLRTNLSTEVYQVSLFVAKNAIKEKPLGYGFNNYELAFKKYIKDYDTHNVETANLNIKDGSIIFSKIVTEFGIFSFFLFYLLLSFTLNKNIDYKIKILFLLPLIIQLFIRGVGYFNAGFLLFLFYTFIISREKHLIKK